MSKMKKLLSAGLVVTMVAGIAVSGTLAYLTSEDNDVNVMTLGNVKIEQHEKERVVDANGDYTLIDTDRGTGYELQDFTQDKPLYPSMAQADARWDETQVNLDQLETGRGAMDVFTNKLAQDKFVLVENTGKSDAYVRTIIAYEAGTVAEEDWSSLIMTSHHFTWEPANVGIVSIEGNNYYVIEYLYKGYNEGDTHHAGGVLPAGELTYNNLAQVYMTSAATNEDVEALDGNSNGTYDILVLSQAVQTAGFENAQQALDAGFGEAIPENVQAWFAGTIIPEFITGDIESSETTYGAVTSVDDVTVFNDANIVTSGGGISAKGTAVFNGGTIVTNSLSTNPRHVFYVGYNGEDYKGHLTINDGEFKFSPTNLTRKGYYICADGEGAVVIVNGGTFHKPSTRSGYTAGIGAINGGEVIIYGGTFAFDPSAFVAEGYQAVESDGWWTVSAK